jgi:hypothetical protein
MQYRRYDVRSLGTAANCMKQIPCCETIVVACQYCLPLTEPKAHYCGHKGLPLIPTLTQMTPICTLMSYLFKMNLDSIPTECGGRVGNAPTCIRQISARRPTILTEILVVCLSPSGQMSGEYLELGHVLSNLLSSNHTSVRCCKFINGATDVVK